MQENKEAERNRITYLIWIIVTMILGLSSRKFGLLAGWSMAGVDGRWPAVH